MQPTVLVLLERRIMENTGGSALAEKVNPDPEEPDKNLESAEDVNRSSFAEYDKNLVEEALSFAEKTPIKFDFHFPEEVWEIILNKLTEDDDRRNCCLAFPILDQILTKSKPVWMFKLIFPLVRSELDERSELTCRRICKQWCADVSFSAVHDSFNSYFEYYGENRPSYVFCCVEDIERFNLALDDPSFNPFLRRNVKIYADDDEFEWKLLDLLSKFGNLIWALEFNGFCYDGSCFFSYEFLRNVLTKTTNLKKIVFRGVNLEYDLYENVMKKPLPPIPSLSSLEMEDAAQIPDAFTSSLFLPYVGHLESIRLDHLVMGQMESGPLQFSKLTHLDVEVSSDYKLEKLLLLNAPLKSVWIKVPRGLACYEANKLTASTFFRFLQNFPLLVKVTICGSRFAEREVDLSEVTNSTVRELHLMDGSENYFSLFWYSNFLQAFKALETLSEDLGGLRITWIEPIESDVTKFWKMFEAGQLYESNNWSLIPTLKNVEIKCEETWDVHKIVTGNRRGFEDYQARRLQK